MGLVWNNGLDTPRMGDDGAPYCPPCNSYELRYMGYD